MGQMGQMEGANSGQMVRRTPSAGAFETALSVHSGRQATARIWCRSFSLCKRAGWDGRLKASRRRRAIGRAPQLWPRFPGIRAHRKSWYLLCHAGQGSRNAACCSRAAVRALAIYIRHAQQFAGARDDVERESCAPPPKPPPSRKQRMRAARQQSQPWRARTTPTTCFTPMSTPPTSSRRPSRGWSFRLSFVPQHQAFAAKKHFSRRSSGLFERAHCSEPAGNSP